MTITADDVLVAADEQLDIRGWTKGTLVNERNEVCALGALAAGRSALAGLPYGYCDGVFLSGRYDHLVHEAAAACRQAIADLVPALSWSGDSVAVYNNTVAKSPDDIHRMFEKARKIIAAEELV